MTTEEREVREAHVRWIEAVNAGDLTRLLGLMTDDVVLIHPGGEPAGREEFAASFTEVQRQSRFECRSELAQVTVMGDVACAWSRDALSVTPSEGGETVRFAGHRLTVYRRASDGRWLLARDAHTLAPVAT